MADINTIKQGTSKAACKEALAHLEEALVFLDVGLPYSASAARLLEVIESLREDMQAL